MSERERFEAWVIALRGLGRPYVLDLERIEADPDDTPVEAMRVGDYAWYTTQAAWLLWQAARSGQAASGSQENARSDVRTGWPPGLLQDDSRELSRALASKPDAMVHARDAVAKIGQPEATTAAPLPKGWDVIRKDDPLKTIIVIAPNGYSAVTTAVSRNPENVLRMLVEDIAHPPARSGADFSASDPCPSCRGVGSIGEPPIQCPFCRLHKNGQEAVRTDAGSEEGRG